MSLRIVRSLALIVMTSIVAFMAPTSASANHTNDDQCPDDHVSTGESATQTFSEDQTGRVLPSIGGEVALNTKLTVQGISQVSGYCDTYLWDQSSQTCVYGQRYDRTMSRIDGDITKPDGVSGAAGADWATSPPNAQSIDSSDDVATTPGAVTDSFKLNQLGEYKHWISSPITQTPCLILPNLVQSEKHSITVVDPDKVKDSDCDPNAEGNPCSPATGNKHQRELDSGGSMLPVTRYYNSHGAIDVGLGYGWKTQYHGRRLTVLEDSILVRRANGRGEYFTKQPNGLLSTHIRKRQVH